MEEPAFLLAMQRVIGGIEIQRDLCRSLGVGIEEQIDEQSLDGRGIGGNAGMAGWLVAAELEPVQRAFARQRRALLAPGRQLARKRCQHRIMAELVVVVEVLITQRNANNPLHHQRLDGMLGVGRIAAVLEAGRQAPGQAQHPVRRPQQQCAGVGGDGAAIKGRNNRATFSRCKRKQVRITLCRHRGLPLLRDKASSQKNFRSIRAPMHLTLVRDAGYAIGQHWLSINLTRLIRPIAWWRLNWSAVGRKHCATCGKPKPLWPKHKRKTKFRSNSMMNSERRSPMPVGGYLKSGTARP